MAALTTDNSSPTFISGKSQGLLTKDGRSYKPMERSRKGVAGADKVERLLRQVGREFYL